MANKNALVTGGADFIGSNFIPFFLKENANYTLVNLDKLAYEGNRSNLFELKSNDRHKVIKGDICNAALVQDIFEKNAIKKWLLEIFIKTLIILKWTPKHF